MHTLFNTYAEIGSFLLILVRVSVILFMFPFFNARVIPMLCKAGLALSISVSLFPFIEGKLPRFPATPLELVLCLLSEFVVGMILGLLVRLFFEGVRIMGQLVGFQTGFAITNILDPQSGTQVSIISNMAYLVAIVLFLVMDGHHILLRALRQSFEILTVGSVDLDTRTLQRTMDVAGDMFVLAVKIGAPAIAALLFTKVAFGLITKLIPQMNIMIVAFPVQIVIGLFFFGVTLNILLWVLDRYLQGLNTLLLSTMHWMKG